ncbi:MAG: glycosyltransferase family 4 protein [Verrucomicrobiota bacterium]|nr:glycosyltransferase family 4 protein [Verrucomicrobiota bacterium]
MPRLAYLFERFPSFGQTFCYREVAELRRQGADISIFSIRRPNDEPTQDWDANIVAHVFYLPEEAELVEEVERLIRQKELPDQAVRAIKEWGRRPDFLRLHQAAYIGVRLREVGIKRVHAHFAGMAARTAYWIKEFFGIDFSLTAHANDIFAPRDFTISLTNLFDAAKLIVTVSDFAVAQLQKKFPHNAGKIHRVYNGIDVNQFTPANFANEIPLILSIGRLIEKKGFADLIRACQRLRSAGRNFRCEIIGEGPLEDSLRAQISDLDLADCVQLVGPKTQQEIGERLAAANVFALPCVVTADGDSDNLPTVIMEAMAAGLPVVSTSVAGIPEMIQPGVNGELVRPGDLGQLATVIDSAFSDRARAQNFGTRGRQLAAEKFSLTENISQLRGLIEL